MSNLGLVSSKSERRAARSVVADFHDAQLGDLVNRVGDAIDRYRAGELDAEGSVVPMTGRPVAWSPPFSVVEREDVREVGADDVDQASVGLIVRGDDETSAVFQRLPSEVGDHASSAAAERYPCRVVNVLDE